MNDTMVRNNQIRNVIVQCTTRELQSVLHLLCAMPRPGRLKPAEKLNLILFSDLPFTTVEAELVREVAHGAMLNRYFQLSLEHSGQTAATSVYMRGVTTPAALLPYGRKNGPNQSFFELLRVAQKDTERRESMTLLLEPDCLVSKDGWLELIESQCDLSPGKFLYGCKPRIDFLPVNWDPAFKAKFIEDQGNRFNGVGVYNTSHQGFGNFAQAWENLLKDYVRKVDPACAFDTFPAALLGYRDAGRNMAVFSNPDLVEVFLAGYYTCSQEIPAVVDASAHDFGSRPDRLQSLLQQDEVAIVHTKLNIQMVNRVLKMQVDADSRKSPSLLERTLDPNQVSVSGNATAELSESEAIRALYANQHHVLFSSELIAAATNILHRAEGYEPRYLFTVVTINRNNGSGLLQTMESVRSQKYTNFQYVVVDGCSSDDSLDIIERNLALIDLAVVEKDSGVYHAMNKGLDVAVGHYVLFLNSGDCFASATTLLDLSDVALANDMPDIIYGDTLLPDNKKWMSNDNPRAIWKGMICSHQSILIRASLARKHRFDESLAIVADWKMIMNCILDGSRCFRVKFCIGLIEPVGISSDYTTRTLERWKVYRCRSELSAQSREEIDRYYIKLLSQRPDALSPQSSPSTSCAEAHDSIESRLIFLVSMPRSGSTLLQRILESAQQVGSCGEPWIALPPVSLYDPAIIEAKYELKLAKHAAREALDELHLDGQVFDNAKKAYLISIYSEFLAAAGGAFFLDKTPRYIHIVEELYRLLPNARFIVLTRQPSALINSYVTTWCRNDYNILLHHKSYMYDFAHGLPAMVNFVSQPRANVFALSYEELCANPVEVCSRLSEFLGFMITPEIKQSERVMGRSLGDPKQINRASGISRSSMGNLGKIESVAHHGAYDAICDRIPAFVWDYFKREHQFKGVSQLNPPAQTSAAPAQAVPPRLASRSTASHSLVITSFNNRSTILEALESAWNQSLPLDEIIVIDDGSTDGSQELLGDYVRNKGGRVKLMVNAVNLGVSASRHRAITASSGEFISTLDGDDTITPLKIAMEMAALRESDADVAFSDITLLTASGNQFLNTRPYHAQSAEGILNLLLTRSSPVPRDLTFSRSVYERSGGFEAGFNLFEDWMLKQRLAVHAGDGSWVHSGVCGTVYDRRNPGLSRRSPLHLVYAQILVMVKNWPVLSDYALDFSGIFRMLLSTQSEASDRLESVLSKLTSPEALERFMRERLERMHQRLNHLPAYEASRKDILTGLDTYLAV